MPTYSLTFSNWTSAANGPNGAAWTDPANAEYLDGAFATASGVSQVSQFLLGTGPSMLGSALSPNEALTGISIGVSRETINPLLGATADQHLYLVVENTPVTAVDFADVNTQWPDGVLTEASYAVSSEQLATLGVSASSIDSGFGVAISAQPWSGSGINQFGCNVDQVSLTLSTAYVAIPPETLGADCEAVGRGLYTPGIGLSNQ